MIQKLQKITYEYVKDLFASKGCQLLETEYIDSSSKMNYVCKCKRKSSISYSNFRLGKRCGYCHVTGRKKKYTIEEVRELFQQRGWKLLTAEYHNARTQKLEYICCCEEKSSTVLTNFFKIKKCMKCAAKERSGNNSHLWNPDRDEVVLNKLYTKKCCGMLSRTLKAISSHKKDVMHELLGYSPKDLQERIESHPNWKCVRKGRWAVDHIFPIKAFLDYGIIDIKIINSLDNLQPLSNFDNSSKNDTYDPKSFQEWLSTKGINIELGGD